MKWMNDTIDRSMAIDTVHKAMYAFFRGGEDGKPMSEREKLILSINKAVCSALRSMPSANSGVEKDEEKKEENA